MELSSPTRDATYSLEDLRALAEIGLLRLPIREAEAKRATRMRAVVAAASDLTRAINSHTHCMLVNCQGSHGAGDLVLETEQLHAALASYAELVRAVVRDHRRLVEAASQGSEVPPRDGSAQREGLRRVV